MPPTKRWNIGVMPDAPHACYARYRRPKRRDGSDPGAPAHVFSHPAWWDAGSTRSVRLEEGPRVKDHKDDRRRRKDHEELDRLFSQADRYLGDDNLCGADESLKTVGLKAAAMWGGSGARRRRLTCGC